MIDITFCTRDCDNKECFRNKENVPKNAIVSWTWFSDCKNFKMPKKVTSDVNADYLRK